MEKENTCGNISSEGDIDRWGLNQAQQLYGPVPYQREKSTEEILGEGKEYDSWITCGGMQAF